MVKAKASLKKKLQRDDWVSQSVKRLPLAHFMVSESGIRFQWEEADYPPQAENEGGVRSESPKCYEKMQKVGDPELGCGDRKNGFCFLKYIWECSM